jgi:hypothetical protein
MAREVDEKKTRKALRKLRRAADRVAGEGGPGLTVWEKDFVDGVTGRLEKYGSAFRDPGKGALDEALSARQSHIVRALDKKGRKARAADASGDADKPKPAAPRSSFKRKSPKTQARGRDINADLDGPPDSQPAAGPPVLRVITGGKEG